MDKYLTDRRVFLAQAAAAALTLGSSRTPSASSTGSTRRADRRIKAIAFEGFPLIDPRPLAARIEERFPGDGERVFNAWRTRQFEYTWLRTLAGQYADFWQTTRDALVFASRSLGLPLGDAERERLMDTYLELKFWRDARDVLQKLHGEGIRLAFLSNFTARMLDAAVANSGLEGMLEPHLSTDRVRAFKPDPRAYAMALKAFDLERENIAFCAAAGWDVAGAKWFGYRTFWVNRMNQPAEELGVQPDGAGSDLASLHSFLHATQAE